MTRSLLIRSATVSTVVAVLTLAVAAPALAHVTVNPGDATKGGYTTVAFRVPNETDKTDTTKVEVNLPADTPIASVSLKPVTGWNAATAKVKLANPIKSDDGDISEAVTKITWTAGAAAAIKPGEFQDFDVSLGPLPDTDQLVFKVLQTYSDGTVVRWIDEPSTDGTEPEHPAPVLKLLAAAATDAPAASAAPAGAASTTAASTAVAAPATPAKGDGNGTPYGIAGILLGLVALVLGALAYRRSGASRVG